MENPSVNAMSQNMIELDRRGRIGYERTNSQAEDEHVCVG
jgi:hypothetical protein